MEGDNDSLDFALPLDLAKFLENMIGEVWMLESPSIQRVYLFFGYDDNLNIGDGLATTGCRFRMVKLDSGSWKAVNLAYWRSRNRGLFSNLYLPFDGLPGILDEDLDPFDEDP